jgi:hypothetical protein
MFHPEYERDSKLRTLEKIPHSPAMFKAHWNEVYAIILTEILPATP